MKISQIELFSVVAIILYIVFFAHSPPYMLRNALGNVYVAGSLFAVLTYITLYHNQTIGVMLILAFLMTMTQVTEHLTGDSPPSTPTPPTNTPPPLNPPASSTTNNPPPTSSAMPSSGTTMDQNGNIVDSTGRVIQRSGSGVTAAATTAATPAQGTPPPATTGRRRAAQTETPPPEPVMSCNIESFASF